MDQEHAISHELPNTQGIEDTLDELKISSPKNASDTIGTPEPNPWQTTPNPDIQTDTTPHAQPIVAYDVSTPSGFATPVRPDEDSPQHHKAADEVLQEFDPLANQEERDARDAWTHSEGHPPPPPPKNPPAALDLPTLDEIPSTSPSSSILPSSPFPSLTALARTFALPLTRGGQRERPRSMDTATSVPSPSTISSFAARQRRNPSLPGSPRISASNSTDGSPDPSRDGSPLPGGARIRREKDKDKDKEKEFDFQKFLDQMKMKGAEPVAKYLRSFLSNFAKRTFTVNDQVKLIHDFLNFIAGKMRETDVWRNASDADFDNALEGMEKLVMNRLYDYTFTPHIAASVPPRPVTSDDLERDRILSQRIALFGWIEPKHLDVPEGEGTGGFMMFAEQELLKINHYKAPRDKLICILNCCKVIFGLIRHMKREEGADSFLPILIFVVLKANPEHLLSNVEFINRFRNPSKLQSEAGYYLSSLMGAVSFIETMDHTSLSNITQEEFERNVEAAISALPSTPELKTSVGSQSGSTSSSGRSTPSRTPSTIPAPLPLPNTPSAHPSSPHLGEEAATPLALPSPGIALAEDARKLLREAGGTISKPLSAIGRIFNEVVDGVTAPVGQSSGQGQQEGRSKLGSYLPGPFAPWEIGRESRAAEGSAPQTPAGAGPDVQYQTPYKPRVRRIPSSASGTASPGGGFYDETPTRPGPAGPYTHQPLALGPSQAYHSQPQPTFQQQQPLPARVQSLAQSELLAVEGQGTDVSRTPTPNLDFAGMQAEIDRAHEHATIAAKETLVQMFPGTDNEVIEWVLEANQGDLGKSIEALLEMS